MGDGASVSLMFATDAKDKVLPTARNTYMALRNHDSWVGVLRYNQLTETEEYHGTEGCDPLGLGNAPVEITDDQIFHTRCWLDAALQWNRAPGKDLVGDAMEAVARKNPYHPIRDYLAPLAAEWDGTERIAHWLTDFCGAEDSDYTRAVAAKTLIGAAKRALQPGCKVDTMLVLVGPQGAKKSTLVRVLGRGWTSDTPIEIGNKDGYEALRGAWIVELPELAGMGGKDVERLKAFFSSPIDTYRPPYGRKPVRRQRSCVFIGSTNDADFLKDATGSRRFWCIQVTDIDIEAFAAVVDQLWAEATLRALEGAPHWLDETESVAAAEAAEAFTSIDPWEDEIRNRIHAGDLESVHTNDVYDWLDVKSKDQHAGTAQRLVRVFCGRLRWQRPANPFWNGGRKGRGFKCGNGGWRGTETGTSGGTKKNARESQKADFGSEEHNEFPDF